MEKPIRQDNHPSSNSSDEKSGFDKFLDRASKVFAILGGIAVICITVHFSQVASSLSEQGIQNSQAQRKYSIQPTLELLPTINYTKDFNEIVVPIKNYGAGQATSVRAMVAYNDQLQGVVHHQFVVSNGEPTHSGKVLRNQPGMQQEMFTLGEQQGIDWIEPGETVQFRFNPWLNTNRPNDRAEIKPDRNFTIFLSYFDIDRNEYLTVTKTFVGGKSALIVGAFGDPAFNDSLIILGRGLNIFDSRTYDDIHLRSETGWFKSMELDSPVVDSLE